MLEMRPPRIRRVAHICKRKLRMFSQVCRVTDDALLQRSARLRRKRQYIMRPLRFFIVIARLGVFGDYDVRVRSAEAERTDRSDTRRGSCRPRSQLRWDF